LGGFGALLLTAHCSPLTAQKPEVERERDEFAGWLAAAPTSPLAAVALVAIGPGIRLGPPGSDIPLAGLAEHRVAERGGRITLEGAVANRTLPPGRPVPLGGYTVVAAGPPGRGTITAFAPHRAASPKRPSWYPYADAATLLLTLRPPAKPGVVRVLAADGVEVEATEAGTVTVPLGRSPATLTVRRMPGATPEETELEVYFRDQTNGKGTYPAGRFVSLIPEGQGRYRLDFNRARNPFCAYSSVYPCPAPWRGNAIAAPVEAGERYGGGGLESIPEPRD
jgi:hypothetical protein